MLNLLAPASCVLTRLLAIPREWAQLLCLAKCSCGGGCIPYPPQHLRHSGARTADGGQAWLQPEGGCAAQ